MKDLNETTLCATLRHLTLHTLQTNESIAAVFRMRTIGVETHEHRSNMSISDDRPYRIIATVAGVLATSCFITAIVALGIGVTSHGIQ